MTCVLGQRSAQEFFLNDQPLLPTFGNRLHIQRQLMHFAFLMHQQRPGSVFGTLGAVLQPAASNLAAAHRLATLLPPKHLPAYSLEASCRFSQYLTMPIFR